MVKEGRIIREKEGLNVLICRLGRLSPQIYHRVGHAYIMQGVDRVHVSAY